MQDVDLSQSQIFCYHVIWLLRYFWGSGFPWCHTSPWLILHIQDLGPMRLWSFQGFVEAKDPHFTAPCSSLQILHFLMVGQVWSSFCPQVPALALPTGCIQVPDILSSSSLPIWIESENGKLSLNLCVPAFQLYFLIYRHENKVLSHTLKIGGEWKLSHYHFCILLAPWTPDTVMLDFPHRQNVNPGVLIPKLARSRAGFSVTCLAMWGC